MSVEEGVWGRGGVSVEEGVWGERWNECRGRCVGRWNECRGRCVGGEVCWGRFGERSVECVTERKAHVCNNSMLV